MVALTEAYVSRTRMESALPKVSISTHGVSCKAVNSTTAVESTEEEEEVDEGGLWQANKISKLKKKMARMVQSWKKVLLKD